MMQERRLCRLRPFLVTLCASWFAVVLCAGCGSMPAAGTKSPALPSPTATTLVSPQATSTFAPITRCASITAPEAMPSIPLPAHTVSYRLSAASGAFFYLECSPTDATPASITAFLDSKLPASGWSRWNPQTDNAGGCGTQANSFWQWVKGGVAVGWNMDGVPPWPNWTLAFCALAFATP